MASNDDSFDVARAFMNDTQKNTNSNKRRLVIKDVGAHLKRAAVSSDEDDVAEFPSTTGTPMLHCHQTFDYGNIADADEEKLSAHVIQVLRDHYGCETGAFFDRHFNRIMKAIRDLLAKKINSVMVEQVVEKLDEAKGAVASEVRGVNSGTQEVLDELASLQKAVGRIEKVQRDFCLHVAGDLRKIKGALGI